MPFKASVSKETFLSLCMKGNHILLYLLPACTRRGYGLLRFYSGTVGSTTGYYFIAKSLKLQVNKISQCIARCAAIRTYQEKNNGVKGVLNHRRSMALIFWLVLSWMKRRLVNILLINISRYSTSQRMFKPYKASNLCLSIA